MTAASPIRHFSAILSNTYGVYAGPISGLGIREQAMMRIMIVDDHPLVLAGIRAALYETQFEIVATARDGVEALEAIPECNADVLILDVLMPRRGGLDVVRALHLRGDTRPVVLLTSGIGDADLMAALDLGVQGIVTKDSAAELLPLCLQHVARGGQWIEPTLLQRALSLARHGAMMDDRRARMTPRERIMAELVTRGLRNRDIAAELGVSEATVKVTIHRLFEKLGLQNRVELALMMRREGGDPHDERLDVTSSALGRMAEASMPGC